MMCTCPASIHVAKLCMCCMYVTIPEAPHQVLTRNSMICKLSQAAMGPRSAQESILKTFPILFHYLIKNRSLQFRPGAKRPQIVHSQLLRERVLGYFEPSERSKVFRRTQGGPGRGGADVSCAPDGRVAG